MKIITNLFQLFYPKLCANCDTQLIENEPILCTFCRHDLPLTNFNNYRENKVANIFYGRIAVEKAYSLLFYRKEGISKKLIQELKYKGNEEIGAFFGNWLGEMLKENKKFSDVDYIIPVPLHFKKKRERGYNQVSKFGEAIGKHLKIPFNELLLTRTSSSKTQTLQSRFERFTSNDTKFLLTDYNVLKNKHILIIDDVITTGATLEACAKELQKTENITISFLTIAYTELNL